MTESTEPQGNREISYEPPATLIPPAPDELAKQRAEREKQEDEYRRRDDAFKERQLQIADEQLVLARRQLTENNRMGKLTLGLLLVSLLASGVSLYQSYLTRSSVQVSRVAAEAAFSQAIANIQQARTSAEANWLNRSNSANSDRQSRTALEAAINASQLDNRAWVGMGAATTNITKQEDVQSGFIIDIQAINTGKTPALDYRAKGVWAMVPSKEFPTIGEKEIIKALSPQPPIRQGVIQPQGVRTFHQQMPKLQGEAAAWLISKRSTLYVFGDLYYVDIFRFARTTKFCLTLELRNFTPNPDIAFHSCPFYNDAN